MWSQPDLNFIKEHSYLIETGKYQALWEVGGKRTDIHIEELIIITAFVRGDSVETSPLPPDEMDIFVGDLNHPLTYGVERTKYGLTPARQKRIMWEILVDFGLPKEKAKEFVEKMTTNFNPRR